MKDLESSPGVMERKAAQPLTMVFFKIENAGMPRKAFLRVGIADLPPVRVANQLCVFPGTAARPFKKIHKTFQYLREQMVILGLDPDDLLHIGIPMLDGDVLTAYSCCIELPLPIDEISDDVDVKTLPGGRYAILRIVKEPGKILRAIRQFQGDYLQENQMMMDDKRPIYEIYYADTMEYCVPIIGG